MRLRLGLRVRASHIKVASKWSGQGKCSNSSNVHGNKGEHRHEVFAVLGFKVWVRVWDLGLRVEGLVFGVRGLGTTIRYSWHHCKFLAISARAL